MKCIRTSILVSVETGSVQDFFEVEFIPGLVNKVIVYQSNVPNSTKKKFYTEELIISNDVAFDYVSKYIQEIKP